MHSSNEDFASSEKVDFAATGYLQVFMWPEYKVTDKTEDKLGGTYDSLSYTGTVYIKINQSHSELSSPTPQKSFHIFSQSICNSLSTDRFYSSI